MKSLLTSFLILTASHLTAQHDYYSLNMSPLTMQDGLLTNYINVIYQDNKGFMWIGTNEGLNRFDGLNFIEYSNHPDDSFSVSSNVITNILEDSHGALWVGTNRGLNKMRSDGRGFTKYGNMNNGLVKPGIEYIAKIFEDKDNRLWVGTGEGSLHLYNRENDQFEHFLNEGKSQLEEIIDGPNETLLLGFGAWVLPPGGGGIMMFDKKSHQFVEILPDSVNTHLSVTNIVQMEGSRYWISTYNSGLYIYDLVSRQLEPFQSDPDSNELQVPDILFGIYKDKQGVLWICTDGWDLMWYDLDSNQLNSLSGLNPLAGTNDLAITTTYEDKNGVFWIGTVNHGILIIDKYKSRFQTLSKATKFGNLSGESVLAIEESKDGGLWIGFDHGGLNYINLKNRQFEQYLFDPLNRNTVADDVINGLFEANNGTLYIGTYLKGFDLLNPARDRFTHYGGNTAIQGATFIKCFYEDRSGNIWIGSRSQGLIKFDPRNQSSINFLHATDDPASISSNHVSTILEENENSLWIGTFNGLNRFDMLTGSFKSWKHEENNPLSLSGVEIYSLCKDQNGNLWIGTDNGLNYYDRLNDNFRHFTTSNGLSSNTIKGILADDQNNLWLSTNRGISRLSISDMSIRNFGMDDGLTCLEFEENSALKSSDGTLYFGSTNGICFFNPKQIKHNPNIPPVVISNLLISNEPVTVSDNSILKRPISEVESITLTHEHSVFSFEFVALNFTSPQKNQYAYMLEGFDEDWNFTRNTQQATYTNIAAGTYTFKVKASNNDGIWNEQGASIEVVVLPVWWKTWWAYSSYLIIFLLAGLGARKAGISRIKLVNDLKMERLAKEKEHEVNQIKIRFFTNLSHEFRTPLTLILGPLDRIISSGAIDTHLQKQLQLMQRNAQRLLRLINQLMDFRKAEQGQMEFQATEVDIVAFVRKIVENFNLLAEERSIDLSFNTSLTFQNVWIDKEMIDKVIYNLLSNAFNFTKKGGVVSVNIEFAANLEKNNGTVAQNRGDNIAITVSDTGKGISKEKQRLIFERFYQAENIGSGTGIGLSLVKSLVTLHRGEISVSSEPGKGSQFIVQLPLGKKHLDESELLTGEPESIEDKQEYMVSHFDPEETHSIKHESDTDKVFSLLIVDDNSELRYFLKESLIDTYNIIEATNGVEGLEQAIKNSVDLIISDVMMPEMDGFEFCAKLKNSLDTSHIPVVLLTAKSGDDNELEGFQTGADEYITKPFSLKLLQARIRNLIESRAKLKRQFKNHVDINTQTIATTDIDNDFLKQVIAITENNMSQLDFSIDEVIKEVGMSRSNFFRKIKSLTGQSPVDFINTIRFKTAGKLLLSGGMNVSEVALQIGYASTKNFRNGFKKHFGVTPTDFTKINKTG